MVKFTYQLLLIKLKKGTTKTKETKKGDTLVIDTHKILLYIHVILLQILLAEQFFSFETDLELCIMDTKNKQLL